MRDVLHGDVFTLYCLQTCFLNPKSVAIVDSGKQMSELSWMTGCLLNCIRFRALQVCVELECVSECESVLSAHK